MAGRTRPGTGWELEELPNGQVDVRLDGRIVVHDRVDLEEAVAYIRRHRSWAGQPVVHIEPDGARTVLA